jgi:NADH:ubiquinone oxidoreductase subunit 5 (subunit L)/multisubunit Na+/H+ antiporter MnhA subunit
MTPETAIPNLLLAALLLPLVSFALISIGYSIPQYIGIRVPYANQKLGAYIAIAAIVGGFVLSSVAMFRHWLPAHPLTAGVHHEEGHGEEHGEESSAEHADEHAAHAEHAAENNGHPPYITGDWYTLGQWGKLKLTIGYYIDTLTVTMFCMVTLIASCVHIYAFGYMHDELHDYTDHEVHTADGHHLHRRGRFHRFFQYLSLFSFSMLGICISGNLAMTFVFWELVGICSYFLIGFYIERQSASTAANKAFIVNRVGDFGMLIGLMAIWSTLGTFNFGDMKDADGNTSAGIFSQLRTEANGFKLVPPDSMVAFEGRDQVAKAVAASPDAADQAVQGVVTQLRDDSSKPWGHWLLFVAGVGVFCGCVGKSAQFPLHTWLPDAMEGPTPVSALVHSATMVAAGVFLVGRVYPIFTPEALLVIAVVGCITLFIAATIAVTAVDIKRVLAYSTISQLGFMMLALGLGGWLAGLFHLITHAFFKSLLFLCSGSVIHAVHSNDMRVMGGLRKKMPITAYTMLVGCLAIAGIGVPFLAGFSGFHSKDLIVEQALSHWNTNTGKVAVTSLLFIVPLFTAGLTAFYMFRLWFMTFAGEPRDHHRYDHAHESPHVMTGPLVLLALFAVCAGWHFPSWGPGALKNFGVENLLEQARPVGTLATTSGVIFPDLTIPSEHNSHAWEIKQPAGLLAIGAAISGILLAMVIYLWKKVSAESLAHTLRPLYSLSWHKWWFDELYDFVFVRPTLALGNFIAAKLDKGLIDGIIHALAWIGQVIALIVSNVGDKFFINKTVDMAADETWNLGLALRTVQTGRLRQYVMFIVVGTIVIFLIASVWRYAVAG